MSLNGCYLNNKELVAQTALHGVIRGDIVELLIKGGANLEKRDQFGETALHLAASRGYKHIVKLLIEANPDLLTVVDKYGQTPLDLTQDEELLEILKAPPKALGAPKPAVALAFSTQQTSQKADELENTVPIANDAEKGSRSKPS